VEVLQEVRQDPTAITFVRVTAAGWEIRVVRGDEGIPVTPFCDLCEEPGKV